ncbi:MAG: nitrilase-related carbon-nitrogen hydrolase [Gammaproteobacteria bacterium]|nr:nitrilase-related carbon-nitrogen hydrolase [Gammaproteobacteria bacterium]
MTLQYTAVGIQNESHMAITIDDYWKDLESLAGSIEYAVWNCSLDLPVRLVAISEGGIGGWCLGGGEEHLRIAREVVPTIPGKETEFLGELCKKFNIFLVAQMIAKDPELMEDRVFNIAFIIDPNGEVIHKHVKTAFYQREPNVAPSDIWNLYRERYGDDPQKLFEAIYPVAKTEIGNIGTLICAEGSFPEAARGLALNGAEIIWRTQYPEPWMGNGFAEIQNKSHAIFNTCYLLAPNIGEIWFPGGAQKMSCGKSQIIDYRGNVISEYLGGGQTLVSAIINIDGLRDFRVRAQWQNLAKDLRIEEYKVIYDAMMARGGIYPANLAMEQPPLTEDQQLELVKHQINRMVAWGVYTAPPGWEPYDVDPEVAERIDAANRLSKGADS